MPGMGTTALCLHMARLDLESPTQWLAMVLTKVIYVFIFVLI